MDRATGSMMLVLAMLLMGAGIAMGSQHVSRDSAMITERLIETEIKLQEAELRLAQIEGAPYKFCAETVRDDVVNMSRSAWDWTSDTANDAWSWVTDEGR